MILNGHFPFSWKKSKEVKLCNTTKLVRATFPIEIEIGKVYQVNNSVISSEKPIGSEEFFNQMVEALGIIIDRRPEGRPRKIETKP